MIEEYMKSKMAEQLGELKTLRAAMAYLVKKHYDGEFVFTEEMWETIEDTQTDIDEEIVQINKGKKKVTKATIKIIDSDKEDDGSLVQITEAFANLKELLEKLKSK